MRCPNLKRKFQSWLNLKEMKENEFSSYMSVKQVWKGFNQLPDQIIHVKVMIK
jgi:hypothetical protein